MQCKRCRTFSIMISIMASVRGVPVSTDLRGWRKWIFLKMTKGSGWKTTNFRKWKESTGNA